MIRETGARIIDGLLNRLQASRLWPFSGQRRARAQIYPNRCERSRLLEHKNHPVSMLVTNWNGEREIAAFLQSYAEYHHVDDCEIIIVDHASSDASRDCIRHWMTLLPIKLICCDRNQRYSAANNLAQAYAEGEVLVFANNDLVFDTQIIPALYDAMKDPDVGLAGVKLYYPDDGGGRSRRLQHLGIRFAPDRAMSFMRPYNVKEVSESSEDHQETAAVTTALAACRRSDFNAVGGFFEDYDYGFEDVDLALKLRRQLGRKNIICTRLAAVHTEFGSQQRQSKRLLLARRQANALIFRDRHNRWLARAVLKSQLTEGIWHLKPLQIRVPQSLELAVSESVSARSGLELLSSADGNREKLAAQCGIWLLNDPGELSSDPVPRGALALALVNPGSAAEWSKVLEQYQLDLMLCDDPEDQRVLREHGGTCLAASNTGAPGMKSGWLDRLLDTVMLHLAKPAVAIKAAMPDSGPSHQPDLALARSLGRELRELGYRVRIDFPKRWESRRMYMDDVTLTLRGDERFRPEAGAVNLLWLIDADHPASDEELNGFDHVFSIMPSEARALEQRLSTDVSALERRIDSNPAATVDRVIRQKISSV